MKVSVIIPYHKDRGFLSEAVESVRRQSYPCELILSQSDANMSYNINRGVEKSTGDVWVYLHEDDTLPKHSIKRRVECMKDFDFIHGNSKHFSMTEYHIYKPENKKPRINELIKRNYINGGTGMYRRDFFDRVKFDESLWTGEEFDFHLNMISKGAKIGYCPYVVYNYRKHDNQKSKFKDVWHRNERTEAVNAIRNRYRRLQNVSK